METTIRKVGNSVGLVLSKEFLQKEHLKINEKVEVLIAKKANLSDVFGSLKTKTSGQKFKDLVREGWK